MNQETPARYRKFLTNDLMKNIAPSGPTESYFTPSLSKENVKMIHRMYFPNGKRKKKLKKRFIFTLSFIVKENG